MTTKYVSIKSALYGLSLRLDERYWNEAIATEWLVEGLRRINLIPVLEEKTALLTVTQHKAQLPADFKYLVQAAKYTTILSDYDLSDETLPSNSSWVISQDTLLQWQPMKLTSNPYHSSICLSKSLYNCPTCTAEFSISASSIMTTNFVSGTVLLAYLAYAVDSDNNILIPDDETLKAALRAFVMYSYWETKYNMMEDGAETRMKFYLQQWQTLKLQAMNLNLPDVSEYENLKNMSNRLVPRENRFNQFFLPLNSRENVKF